MEKGFPQAKSAGHTQLIRTWNALSRAGHVHAGRRSRSHSHDIYPAQLRTTKFVAGVEPYVDQADKLPTVPAELEGQLLVQTLADSEEDARLVSLFSKTQYPATNGVDQVCSPGAATRAPPDHPVATLRTSRKAWSGITQVRRHGA